MRKNRLVRSVHGIAKRHFKQIFKKLLSLSYYLPEQVRKKVVSERIEKFLFQQVHWSGRTQRVYLKVNLEPFRFFSELNKRKIDYLLLRSWEKLPFFPPDEDINLLVKDEHRDLLNDLVSTYDVRGVKCDIYTKSGSKGGSRFGLPVFPYNLVKVLFEEKIKFNGVFVPAPKAYFASEAYHALFHKGQSSGLAGFKGGNSKVQGVNYSNLLMEMATKLDLEVEISAIGLFDWLKKQGFTPAEDTLTKLVENNPELSLFESPLYSDIRGGELLVYVIRDRLLLDGYLDFFLNHLQKDYAFEILDVKMLTPSEQENCTHQLRGGKWDRGPYKVSGGNPVAVVVAFDFKPQPLSSAEQKKQSRMTNRNNLSAKMEFRNKMALIFKDEFYNGVHSADNEMDAWFYLSQVNEEYCKQYQLEVEKIRETKTVKRKSGPLTKTT